MTATLLLALCLAADPSPGIRPLGLDGKPLNLDFEAGTLKDWLATGNAFAGQPVKGDTVAARRNDMKSGHQGDFWIGTFEVKGDAPKGTLTSVEFKVTHPWASYLVGGGQGPTTRVEILHKGQAIHKAHGSNSEEMHRIAADLSKFQNEMIQIRLVDEASGGWGHINFDDFVFHAAEPKAITKQARPINTGQTPEKTAAGMTVPEGFSVTLFAGEPDVKQPIAFCFDDRGRLWVAEAYTYPKRDPSPGPFIVQSPLPSGKRGRGEGRTPPVTPPTNLGTNGARPSPPTPLPQAERGVKGDRILVFEDTDGDGKFDKRTVVVEGLNLVSGLEYGFGGIFVGAAPYLMHIPIKDDKPAGEPVILLDGWAFEDTHETLNSFMWGPDGWLYGCHGVFTHSNVGKPGTDKKDRTPINAGVWRWHPTRKVFEVFAHGTSNPWGLDYNEHGDFFVEACVIPHLFHIVQGGRYQRQAGEHFNKHTYIDIPTIADHLHYRGDQWNDADRKKSTDAGGGHAHCGLMCYQGGAWPKEYHGQLFMGNIHGQRINMDTLHPKGSTYVAKHGKDFLHANDAWSRFINLKYGPDGNVYLIDWYDAQACHHNTPEVWDRTNGRIYKVSYRGTKPVVGLDLQKCTDEELVKYQTHENEWYVRHARRILQERSHKQQLPAGFTSSMEKRIATESNSRLRLRYLWTQAATDRLSRDIDADYLNNEYNPYMLGWYYSLCLEDSYNRGENEKALSTLTASLIKKDILARSRPAGFEIILRHVLSQAHTMPFRSRGALLLLLHVTCIKDDCDPQLLAMLWHALEPLGDEYPQSLVDTCVNLKYPNLTELAAKRVGATGNGEALDQLFKAITSTTDVNLQLALMLGCTSSVTGRKGLEIPKTLPAFYERMSKSTDGKLVGAARNLAVAFREPRAMAELRETLADGKSNATDRLYALNLLRDVQDPKLSTILPSLLKDPILRVTTIRAMASLGGPDTPKILLDAYVTLSAGEKRDAIATLAAKPAFAMALLDALASKKIPMADVPAETIRQLRAFNDKALNDKVVAVWGVVRDTPADRKKLIDSWKRKLNAPIEPDLAAGRAIFAKTCQQCHTLYGVGEKVGPDITGSNRGDLNYLLENIFDASAVVPKEYAATTFDLEDGRKLIGIVKEDGSQITLATERGIVKFAASDVARRKPSELSMMPDDITKQLTDGDVRNLIGYLRHPQQVPMKATTENARDFFNGKDLTGWDGDKEVWSVENGEIVGKSAKGLRANNFLTSVLEAENFKLTCKVKLVPNKENSGIQFRSVRIEKGEMRGPQADIGAGWWGKLYEESGRGLLAKEGGEKHVKPDDWNEYTVEAKGPTVKIWINGQLVADYTDDKLARKGLFGLQAHSGGPIEVRFKELKLEVLP